jgi:arginine/ornithine N-succinyltransferase beta subunit
MLKAEGFELNGMVDIFDAGPVVRCEVKRIRAIRDSVKATVEQLSPSPGTPGEGRGEGEFDRQTSLDKPNHPHPNPLPEYRERGPEMLIANTQQTFRATLGSVAPTPNGIRLESAVAAALNVKVGDTVRFVFPKPAQAKEGFDAPSSI